MGQRQCARVSLDKVGRPFSSYNNEYEGYFVQSQRCLTSVMGTNEERWL